MNVVRTYNELRRTIGILGILLPFVQLIGILIAGEEMPKSISMSYYTAMGDVFVGTLSAVGFFMFFYIGYNKFENILGNIAGISAIIVALCPCESEARMLHLIFAAILFIIFAIFSFQFSKGEKRKTGYIINGIVILISLVLIVILSALKVEGSYIYVLETIMLIAFGISWLVKGKINLLFKKI